MKNNWQIKKLGDICDVIAGQSPEGRFYNKIGEGLPFYQGKKEFGEKVIGEPTTWTTKITKEALDGDILMSVRAPVGPTNFSTEKICIGRGLAAIRAGKEINKDFLFIFFQKFESEIVGNKGAVFDSISKTQIENIEILLPSLLEQNRIVKILDEVFEGIEKAKENAKKNLQNSRELFELGRNNIFNKIVEQGSVAYLPGVVLRDKRAIKRGPFGSSITKACFVESGYKVYEQKNAIKDDFSLGRYYINEEKFKELEAFKITGGDIIISCSGTIGKVAIAPDGIEKGVINQALLKISFDETKMLRKYFKHFFENLVSTGGMINKIKGAAIKNITSVKELKQIPIPVPRSFSEQKSIVEKLDALSEQTKKLEEIYKKKIADLDELKKSVLKKAFNGEL